MPLKPCSHCKQSYLPQKSELSQVFCATCIQEYNQAEVSVKTYMIDHPQATIAQLIMSLKVPAVFVHYMYRMGRFFSDLSERKPMIDDKRPCYFCHRTLSPTEEVYCTTCNTIVQQRMHTRYNMARNMASPITRSGGPWRMGHQSPSRSS